MANLKLSPDVNVILTILDSNKKPVDRIAVHNVLTQTGRKWLRDLISVSQYATSNGVIQSDQHLYALTNARPAFVGIGYGGSLQSYSEFKSTSDPETKYITKLQNPIPYKKENNIPIYLKQILPQTSNYDSSNPDIKIFPDDGSVTYRCIFEPTEITFIGNNGGYYPDVSKDYLAVPISEAGLFLSSASPDSPDNVGHLVAYVTMHPRLKTLRTYLSIDWIFDFKY